MRNNYLTKDKTGMTVWMDILPYPKSCKGRKIQNQGLKGVLKMDRLEEIREEIRAIDPRFTDKLIDLLFDYMAAKWYEHLTTNRHTEGED